MTSKYKYRVDLHSYYTKEDLLQILDQLKDGVVLETKVTNYSIMKARIAFDCFGYYNALNNLYCIKLTNIQRIKLIEDIKSLLEVNFKDPQNSRMKRMDVVAGAATEYVRSLPNSAL